LKACLKACLKTYCGLDPSLRGLTISKFTRNKLIDFLFIETKSSVDLLNRIIIQAKNVSNFIITNKIERLNIEIPYYNRTNAKVYNMQSRLYQQLIYELDNLNVKYAEYEPRTIKKNLSSGSMDKKDISYYFQQNMLIYKGLNSGKLNQLEIEGLLDSIAIGIMGENLNEFKRNQKK